MVVLDGEELPISTCLTQHRRAQQLGSSLLLQEGPVLARPSNAGSRSCYSAMFHTQGIQYSQVCGRIIGYQIGEPDAFNGAPRSIDDQ